MRYCIQGASGHAHTVAARCSAQLPSARVFQPRPLGQAAGDSRPIYIPEPVKARASAAVRIYLHLKALERSTAPVLHRTSGGWQTLASGFGTPSWSSVFHFQDCRIWEIRVSNPASAACHCCYRRGRNLSPGSRHASQAPVTPGAYVSTPRRSHHCPARRSRRERGHLPPQP